MAIKFNWFAGVALGAMALPAAAQTPAGDNVAADEIVVTGVYTLPNKIDTATGLGLTVQETPSPSAS